MLIPSIDFFVQSKIMALATHNRETCEHFIDYEILDALPTEELKEKYILQLINFEVIIRPQTDSKEASIHIYCFEKLLHNKKDCSACYEKTLQDLKEEFKGFCK